LVCGVAIDLRILTPVLVLVLVLVFVLDPSHDEDEYEDG
jgi:hypothetical protein